jgi:hypothetical protein
MGSRLRRLLSCLIVATAAVTPAVVAAGTAAAETSNTSDESQAQAAQAAAAALSWLAIGGPYASIPVVLPEGDLLPSVVFELGFDDNAYVHVQEGAGWSDPIWLDGLWLSTVQPAITVKGSSQPYIEAFGVGYDGAMWYGRDDVDGWMSS